MRSLVRETELATEAHLDLDRKRSELPWLDLLGLSLAAALVGWVYVAASTNGGAAGPVALLVVFVASAYVVGRLAGARAGWLAPTAVMLAAGAVAVESRDVLFDRMPSVAPFGYAHFEWAFFLQAGLAGAMVALLKVPLPVRVACALAGMAFGLVAFGGSVVGPAVVGVLIVIGFAFRRPGWARAGIVAAAVGFLAVVGATIVLGAQYSGAERWGSVNALLEATSNRCDAGPGCSLSEAEGLDRYVFRTVTERRVAMWHDAIVLMGDNPLTGVGPGRFQATSPIALGDRDEPWAHHEYLHMGAETGLPGMILLIGLFVWGFARLLTSGAPDGVAVIGAVAVAALGVHASLDYVLHFPAAPVAAAGLLGAAASTRHGAESAR